MQKKENKRIIGKQKNLAAETDSQASEYNVVEKINQAMIISLP